MIPSPLQKVDIPGLLTVTLHRIPHLKVSQDTSLLPKALVEHLIVAGVSSRYDNYAKFKQRLLFEAWLICCQSWDDLMLANVTFESSILASHYNIAMSYGSHPAGTYD